MPEQPIFASETDIKREIEDLFKGQELSPVAKKLLLLFIFFSFIASGLSPDNTGSIPIVETAFNVGLYYLESLAEYSSLEEFFQEIILQVPVQSVDLETLQRISNMENNEHYQPISRIIEQGVEDYNSRFVDSPAFWDSPEKTMSDWDVANLFLQPLTSEELTLASEHFGAAAANVGDSPLFLGQKILFPSDSDAVAEQQILTLTLHEVTRNRLKTAYPEVWGALTLAEIGMVEGTSEERMALFSQVRSDIEAISTTEFGSEPVPLWRIYSYFLEKNGGSIHRTNIDARSFFYSLSRESAYLSEDQFNSDIEWILENVQDQFNEGYSWNGITNYSELTAEEKAPVISSLGTIYHTFDILHLTDSGVPSNLIRFAVAGEYTLYDHIAEEPKLWADVQTLGQLDDLAFYYRRLD